MKQKFQKQNILSAYSSNENNESAYSSNDNNESAHVLLYTATFSLSAASQC